MDILSAIAAGLSNLGLGIASSAMYDYLKSRFGNRTNVSQAELQQALGDFLVVHGITASASTVMELLASKGVLQVIGSDLYAPESLAVGAASGAQFTVGHGTTTRTDKTAVEAGHGAFVTGSNAAVVQNPDGSISFHVGGGQSDGISFWTSDKK